MHKAGVHCVGLPMVTQLAEMAQKPENEQTLPPMEEVTNSPSCEFFTQFLAFSLSHQESVVEHLICTQMTSEARASPIRGLTVTHPPTRLLALTRDYRLEPLNISQPHFGTPPPLFSADGKVFQSKEEHTCPKSFGFVSRANLLAVEEQVS